MIGRLGELLFVGFDGAELTVELRSFLGAIRPGGIILFKRNIVDPDQTLRLIADLGAMFEPAPLIAVDEEGGRVSRMRPMAPTLPAAARLAQTENAAAVRTLAASLGGILASAGFDLDFAPVVDLCRPDAPNGIGDRSFGADPERACAMAGACLDGLADAGVTGCLKHFPGLGPTLFDSHHHLPTVQKEAAPFRIEDLLPYRRLHARSAVVMVGHGHYPFFSGADPIAATLSAPVVTDLLRGEIGYAGVALADDLEMKAVSDRIPYPELAPRAIAAGCDMALVCRSRDAIEGCLAGLRTWAGSGRQAQERIAGALSRVEALRAAVAAARARRGSPPPSVASFRAACADLSGRIESMA